MSSAPDPFTLFESWLADAQAREPNDPNAMTLATTGPDGQPSARMVLLKDHGPAGFVFYTNLESRKGADLASLPLAALLFHWKSLRRQIRIEGAVTPVEPEEADAYFASRPRASQLGAWASHQSRPLPDRATFEARFAEAEARFAGGPVPRPAHWSGWRVNPHRIEFWRDREFRLHERVLYLPDGKGAWTTELLYP